VRLSIQTPQYGTDLASLEAVWRAAADLGFRAAWLMDHLYPIMVPPSEPMLEAWTTLAALAARTESIRVGILVSANTFRHPAVLARMATTVDHVADGRLEVGLGAAWCEAEHVENGLPFPALRDRLGMLDEACTVMRRLWTEPAVSFDGRYYRLRDAACAPKPVQARLPLLLGGQGERRALRIVARHADRWNASGDVATLTAKAAVLRAHCAAIGRDPATIALTVRNDFLVTDDAAAARAATERLARFMRQPPDAVRGRVWIGDRDEVAAGLAAFAAAGSTK
jgi:F420-dependent oxidoreductase-like protein